MQRTWLQVELKGPLPLPHAEVRQSVMRVRSKAAAVADAVAAKRSQLVGLVIKFAITEEHS